MANNNPYKNRVDYWTECGIPPTIEEMKKSGAWDRLPKEKQDSFLDDERYREENKEKIARFRAVFEESMKVYEESKKKGGSKGDE